MTRFLPPDADRNNGGRYTRSLVVIFRSSGGKRRRGTFYRNDDDRKSESLRSINFSFQYGPTSVDLMRYNAYRLALAYTPPNVIPIIIHNRNVMLLMIIRNRLYAIGYAINYLSSDYAFLVIVNNAESNNSRQK